MDSKVDNHNLVEQICFALFGGSFSEHKEQLRTALYKHLRMMQPRPITRQAIKRWLDDDGAVTRPDSLFFLHDFVANFDSSNLAPSQREILEQVFMFSSKYANLRISSVKTIDVDDNIRLDRGVTRIIGSLIRVDAERNYNETVSHLFTTSNTKQADQSYFLVFRNSTTEGSIVKTFLVCKRPQRNFLRSHSFVQFIRGGDNYFPDVIKESQGIILRLERSYYWIGYNYRVDADDEQNGPAEYQANRVKSKRYPISMEIISAESIDIEMSSGLFPALIMTSAAINQPIVARAAILHLGTSQSLGKFIRHTSVNPTELERLHLATDLMETVDRLRHSSQGTFGRVLDRHVKRQGWRTDGANTLASTILEMIDNTCAAGKPPRISINEGAIETFSNRPGTRPRP